MSQSNRGRYGLGYPERGRWKGNNQSGAWSTWKKMPNDRVPLEPEDLPKGHVLAELELNKLEAEVEQHGTVKYTKEGYELLASFNWFPNDGKPAIIVPGLAARWTPPPLPAWLTPDAGLYYVDQNAYFWPTSPLEPALRAIFTLNPTFDPNPIDLVIDRNALRKLFRFASGDKKLIHDFKFYTEVINNTVLTTRWEKQAAKVIAEDEFRGFGHSFEKEFTKYTKGLEGSTSHNRMAKYRFGGLNLIVRFSADAFLGSKDMSSGESTSSLEKGSDSAQAQANKAKDLPWRRRRAGSNSTPAAGNKTRTTAGVAGPAYIQRHDRPQASDTTAQDPIEEELIDLSDVFDKSLKIGPEKKPPAAGNTTRTTAGVAGPAYIQRYDRPQASDTTAQDPTEDLIDLSDVFDKSLKIEPEKEFEKPPAPLEIIPGGILMPQERVLEIKTRADNRIIDLTDQIPQLWFSDTSNLYIGYHHRGSFMRVDTEAMNAKALEVWEDQNQDNLKKMSQLLRKITQVVRSIEGGRAQVACVGGKLKIFALEEGETAIGTLPVDLRGKWNVK